MTPTPMPTTSKRWVIVVFMFLFMLINYADKAVIGLSAVPIIKELKLTHTQFGTIGSSFFLLFSLSGILVGFLANRVATKYLLLVMALVWACAQLPMIGTVGLGALIASRIVLGAGEGPAFPMAVHAVYKWFDDARRTLPTSVIACGAAFGAGIIAPGIVWIITHYSWHTAFGVLGVIGFLWALAWYFFGEEGPVGNPFLTGSSADSYRLPYRELLLSRTAIGVFIAGFVAYWALTLNIVWLAAYLVKGAGFSQIQAGWLIVFPSLTQIVLAPTIALISQRLIKSGVSSRIARGVFAGGVVLVAGICIMSFPGVDNLFLKVPLIVLGFSIGSVIYTLGPALIGEISPPSQRGAMLGITNSIHTLAGLAAPIIMGAIVDVGANPAAGFRTGFFVAGVFVAAGGVIAMLLINPEADLIRFRQRNDLSDPGAGAVAVGR